MNSSAPTVLATRSSTATKPASTPAQDPQQRPSGPHNALQQSLDRRW